MSITCTKAVHERNGTKSASFKVKSTKVSRVISHLSYFISLQLPFLIVSKMPSTLTAASSSSTTAGAGRMLSKVNSFQRTWDDDEPGSSQKIPWSSSPIPES